MNLKYSIERVSRMLGKSRQGYYKRKRLEQRRRSKENEILRHVHELRSRQPRVGVKKLHRHLLTRGVKIGRDRLFCLLRRKKLLVKPKCRYVRTTNSHHWFKKYKNLVKNKQINCPGQVMVGDITYLETLEGFCYLSLLTDVYSHKIVGYSLSHSLSVEGSLKALKMALGQIKDPSSLIHHSDRGIQYCCKAYTDKLKDNKVQISMTEENHVYENALAERVNGILKNEFLLGECLPSYSIASKMVEESVDIYNNERLHMSIAYATPTQKFAA